MARHAKPAKPARTLLDVLEQVQRRGYGLLGAQTGLLLIRVLIR